MMSNTPDELEMPDLIIEAHGTVTPPPQQPCPDEGEEQQP